MKLTVKKNLSVTEHVDNKEPKIRLIKLSVIIKNEIKHLLKVDVTIVIQCLIGSSRSSRFSLRGIIYYSFG